MSNFWKYILTALVVLNVFTMILLSRKADIKMDGIRFTTPEINISEKGIKDDLINRATILDIKGVKGGKIAFNNPDKINILSEKWVMAYFDDGHIDGLVLLEYKIESSGKISWRVIDVYLY
jgi:hypothetical protein